MKPLYLKVAGLNSYKEEQEVDFTRLCETGVFGIFGPTGSGKSTLLDAITLALYGKVERAERGTQGIINQNEEKAYVQFTFSIGGRNYTAERTYKKSKDGGVSLNSCRLIEENEKGKTVLAEKKMDMEEKIQQILGLSSEDFTRAVVLPQGKFQEFLTLQGKEKRKMLQRLFALEKYGESLMKRIRDKLNNINNQLQLVLSRQNELGDASEEALQKAFQDFKKCEAILSKVKEKNKEYEKKAEEYKEIRNLQNELQEAKKVSESLKALEQKMRYKEEKLDLSKKAEQVWPYFKIVNDEKNNLEAIERKIGELNLQLEEESKAFLKAKEEYENCDKELKTRGKELETKLFKLEEGKGFEKTKAELDKKLKELRSEYNEQKQKADFLIKEKEKLDKEKLKLQIRKKELAKLIEEKEKEIEKKEDLEIRKQVWQALKEINDRYREVEADVKGKEEQIKQVKVNKEKLQEETLKVQNSLDQKREEFNNLEKPVLAQKDLYQRQNQLYELNNIISTLEHYYNDLNIILNELDSNKKLANKLMKIFAELNNQIDELNSNKLLLNEKIKGLEEEYRKLEGKNLAVNLSEKLEMGKPCPVCGSLEHPDPVKVDSDLKNSLQKLNIEIQDKKQQLNSLEEKIKELTQKQLSTKAEFDIIEENLEKLVNRKKEIELKIEKTRYQLKDDWSKIELNKLKELKNNEEEYLKTQKIKLDDFLEKEEKIKSDVEILKNKFNELSNKLAVEKGTEKTLVNELEKLMPKLDEIKKQKENLENEFNKISRDIPGEKIENQLQLIKLAIKEVDQLRKEEKEKTEQLDKLIESQFKNQEKLQLIAQKMEVLETEGKGYRKQFEELELKIKELTEGKKIQDVIDKVKEELKNINNNLTRALEKLEKKRDSLEDKKRLHLSSKKVMEEIKGRLEKALSDLQNKLKEFHFDSINQVEDALCTKEEQEKLSKEIEDYANKKLLNQQNIEDILKKLNGRNLSKEEWLNFEKEFSQIKEELEVTLEKNYKLKGELKRLEENHARWKQLEEEKNKWQNLLGKLQELEKLFRGNKFVEFIAEEQLMQVALDASKRLGELTGYRYALEVNSEGGFIIRDDANGGMRRSVTTLSGGETFLTSLALALALSSQVQLRGKYPLEFFFLDEGFGTLDSHLLETVINSLERLQSNKMTIGVISHVPELKTRIARKLIVIPAEKGGKGSRLIVETE